MIRVKDPCIAHATREKNYFNDAAQSKIREKYVVTSPKGVNNFKEPNYKDWQRF